jgi:ribonuclease Z
MKLIFYGTTGAVPTQENTNVSFAVTEGGSSLLIDASGAPTHSLLRSGINPLDLDALVLTHAHPDHLYAFPALIHSLWLMKRERPLSIMTNQETAAKAKQLGDVFALLTRANLFPIDWYILDEGTVENIPGIRVELFPVEHSVVTSGVKCVTTSASLVYSADTRPSSRIIRAAEGVDVLIHEASGNEHHEKDLNAVGHSSARQAGETAQKAGVEILYLCHFDPRHGISPQRLQQEAQKMFQGSVVVPDLFTAYQHGSS